MLDKNTTPHGLAKSLGTTYGKIIYNYYKNDIDLCYQSFDIPKKNGGTRRISSPEAKLMNLQDKLAVMLLDLYKPKLSAKAFIKGRSILENAKPHAGKAFVFNIDIQDFFPSITFARVRGMLSKPPYSIPLNTASVIAHLTTLAGRLPQGAPTSPVLSNMICRRLDTELLSLARRHKCSYSRYADDITFSFRQDLEDLPGEIVNTGLENDRHFGEAPGTDLQAIMRANGFSVKESKTRLQGRRNRQTVTGLVVNKRPNVDRRFVRKTRALIHSIESFGVETANDIFSRKNDEKKISSKNDDKKVRLERHIFGKLLFIKQIKGADSSVYHNLAVRFNNLPIKENVPIAEKPVVNHPTTRTQRAQFSKRCWVISVESEEAVDVTKKDADGKDVQDVEIQEVYLQGTAFMLSEGRLITSAHLFTKFKNSDDPKDFEDLKVYVFKADKQSSKIEVKLDRLNGHLDIAVLRFPDELVKTRKELVLDYFQVEKERELSQGELVLVLGNPDIKRGTMGVGAFWANVTNNHMDAGVHFVEIDKEIKDGNSGGPVLNSDLKVVGIAAKGMGGGNVSSLFVKISALDYLYK
jgi:RNA-directed DNA polymerase